VPALHTRTCEGGAEYSRLIVAFSAHWCWQGQAKGYLRFFEALLSPTVLSEAKRLWPVWHENDIPKETLSCHGLVRRSV
jgi:hypothetical protein